MFPLFLVPYLPILLLPSLTLAIQQSQAGLIDWHTPLIGVPLAHTPPTFHRVHLEDGESTKSVIVQATESGVLSALNPVDGEVVWRVSVDEEVVGVGRQGHVLASLSGPGGSTLRIHNVLTGVLLHETRLHAPSTGQLTQPPSIGVKIAFLPGSDDVFVLTNGRTVTRFVMDAERGGYKKAWEWTSLDQSSLTIYSHLLITPTHVYIAGLSKSFASYELALTTLSTPTAQVVSESTHVPSASPNDVDSIAFLRAQGEDSDSGRLVYLSGTSLSSIPLTGDVADVKAVTVVKGPGFTKLIDLGLSDQGVLSALKLGGAGVVLRLFPSTSSPPTLEMIWEFRDSASMQLKSTYTGGLDKDSQPYVARVYWRHDDTGPLQIQVLAPHLGERGVVSGVVVAGYDIQRDGVVIQVSIDAATPSPHSIVSRLVLTTAKGSIQLWHADKVQWKREESLASVDGGCAVLVGLPEQVGVSGGEGGEGVLERLSRQMHDAKDFHHYLLNFIHRFLQPSSETLLAFNTTTTSSPTHRDTFGVHQLLIVATRFGTVHALDSSTGRIRWTRTFGLGWLGEPNFHDASGEEAGSGEIIGGRVEPTGVYVLRESEGERGAEVGVAARRRANNGLIDTVVFHLDALTGADARPGIPVDRKEGPLQAYDIIQGPAISTLLLPAPADSSEPASIVFFDERMQSYMYPHTQRLAALSPQLHFPLVQTVTGARHALLGHGIVPSPEHALRPIAYPTWRFPLRDGESVLDVQKPNHLAGRAEGSGRRVASWGRVTGNRTTLYKWVNEGAVVLLTQNFAAPTAEASEGKTTCGLYVVDGVKGTVYYHVDLSSVPSPAAPHAHSGKEEGTCNVKVSFVENWLVYHYFDTDEVSKGWKVVTVEMYEGVGVDDKTSSSDTSSFNEDRAKLTVFERAFVVPYGFAAMTTSETLWGISTKDLIVATHNHRVATIPRKLLNPRRPTGKPTSEEAEEGLMQYEPTIPDDPRRVLSHIYEIANIHTLLSSPTLLESTSLVFAYGPLDLFMSRVSPSGTFDVLSPSFNKVQLVLTIAVLLGGVLVTRPMVRRKRERERWYE